MAEELLINFAPMETRVALIENGMLQEVYIERVDKKGIVGNIYKGKVARVLPGMQAAFVDIGLERAAFIHAADLQPHNHASDERPAAEASISSMLREGQSLVVQVTKDPIGTKGARLTTNLSIPSRYLVLMPDAEHIGISQRIESEEERERLRSVVSDHLQSSPESAVSDGFILRTVSEGASADDIQSDIKFLQRLWSKIQERMKRSKAPSILYEDLPLHMRALRDMASPGIERVRIDSRETFQKACEFVSSLVPEMADRLEYYPGERPIFDLYNVEDEIQKALGRKVELKSGGYLIFDQTEAMTTVDINTGAYVGHRTLEETIFKTNLEAATAIGRQLRLRNLGGIIIIDFIDMEDPEHQRQVLRTLQRALDKDHVKCKVMGVSELGLVEMTRKRTRESLEQLLCEPCSQCHGRGSMKTPETVCYEIFREILREARAYDTDTYLVLASPAVVDRLHDEESDRVADLQEFIGKTIRFQSDTAYSNEQFDVVLR